MPLTPLDIKVALLQKGITMAAIARALGVERSHVSQVVKRKRTSPRVEEAVAAALEMTRDEVFGEAAIVAA